MVIYHRVVEWIWDLWLYLSDKGTLRDVLERATGQMDKGEQKQLLESIMGSENTVGFVNQLRGFRQQIRSQKENDRYPLFYEALERRLRKDNDPFLPNFNKFMRERCLFIIGNWNSAETMSNYLPTPKVKEICRVFRERRLEIFIINEFRTSKVNKQTFLFTIYIF